MYRHRFDPLSAAFGVIFLLVGLPLLVGTLDLFAIRWGWVVPILAIGAGVALLLSGVRGRDETTVEDDAA